jgi:hypothetical protein
MYNPAQITGSRRLRPELGSTQHHIGKSDSRPIITLKNEAPVRCLRASMPGTLGLCSSLTHTGRSGVAEGIPSALFVPWGCRQ